MTTLAEAFWENVLIGDGCWEWSRAFFKKGYGAVRVDGRARTTHTVAWEKTFGPIPKGLWVLHRCDNRRCVRPDHLFLGTPKDNSLDMVRKGRAGSRKLTLPQVYEIRSSSEGLKALSERFGVSRQAIWKVRTGVFYAGL